MEYTYNNIIPIPDLLTYNDNEEMISGIHYDVINSEMTNKNIDYCLWHEETLYIYYDTELSQEDKTILDSIVENNI